MNTPQLRFKEFTNKWDTKDLKTILKVNSGRDYKHLNTGDIPVYGTGGYMLSVNRSLSEEDAIGIGRKGSIDKPQKLKAPFWTVDTLFFCTSKNETDLDFLFVLFNKINWKKYDESTGVPSLSKNTIENISIYVPSINEQQKMGEFFNTLDSKIQLHQEKVELLKAQKKGIMQKIFSQELRFKDEAGEDYPEWKTYKLVELVAFFKGQALSKNDLAAEGVPCVLYGQLYTIYGEIIDKVISKTQNNRGFNGEIGDVLIPSSGETALDIACASALKENALLGGDLNVLRPNKNLVNGNFLAYLLSNGYKNELFKLAQGATVVHLYNNSLKSLSINLPIIEEQQKIANTLICLDKKIKKETRKVSEIAIQKQAFMQQMFVN